MDEGRLNSCGCCEGVQKLTPATVENLPGLSALAYRVGTYGRFKASMIAALSLQPQLKGLRTRAEDDPTMALLDAWAAVLDVLTFYQERIADEGFLRTAAERASILELARSIGYELRPGVAASTYLAFELETAKGAPRYASLDIGTRVQSVPGPDEKPQIFETTEKLQACADWNKLRPRQNELCLPVHGDTSFYLKGTTTNLKPGDSVLIVGEERADDKSNENWEVRRIAEIRVDTEADRTFVRVKKPLGSQIPRMDPPRRGTRVYALRLRANIFGHNAPEYIAVPTDLVLGADLTRQSTWADALFTSDTERIHLDTVYKEILVNSWVVLVRPENPGRPDYAELYKVKNVEEESTAHFPLSAKTTRLTLSGENIERFSPRETTVLAQSEKLELAEGPIQEPVMGAEIVLDQLVGGLPEGRTIVVSGKRARAQIKPARPSLELRLVKGPLPSQRLETGDEWIVLEPPADVPEKAGVKKWRLSGFGDVEGEVEAPLGKISYVAARSDDEIVNEVAFVRESVPLDEKHTRLFLKHPLDNVFDRATVTIAANVARATHGETKQEVLGGGDASQPFEKFILKQNPLTYVAASTPGGAACTLQVRVNDLLWDEVGSLFGLGPANQNYIVRVADDGKATVQFGDGITGARLPTGTENVQAQYRVGIGLEGMVRAGQLSLLLTRPLGVKGVTNPLAATGAADPEAGDQARQNAPRTVLTLDRAVSLADYENFARAFAGIGKARATWMWQEERRIVHITVAASNGGRVGGDLAQKLAGAIADYSVPHQPFDVESFVPLAFGVTVQVLADGRHLPEKVLAAVRAALLDAFSFERRTFGQGVTESEVMAVVQGVEGVEAAFVQMDAPSVAPHALLTVDPSGITVTERKR